MTLNQLNKGNKAEITAITADKALRDRFTSFGIVPGETAIVREHSLAKQTIEVEIEGTLVVLRANEAEKIEIEIQ